jgi:hypothetical protein
MQWEFTWPQGDLHSCHLGDLTVENQGQVLECSLCIRGLAPERRAAAAVWVDQRTQGGADQPCGLRVYTIPAHHHHQPVDVMLRGIRFILPGRPRPQDGPRRLIIRADVNYVDRQQTCLIAPRPCCREAEPDYGV